MPKFKIKTGHVVLVNEGGLAVEKHGGEIIDIEDNLEGGLTETLIERIQHAVDPVESEAAAASAPAAPQHVDHLNELGPGHAPSVA